MWDRDYDLLSPEKSSNELTKLIETRLKAMADELMELSIQAGHNLEICTTGSTKWITIFDTSEGGYELNGGYGIYRIQKKEAV